MKKLILILASFKFLFAFSQCKPDEIVFKSGEELTYEVNYNWGFIWLSTGEVTFSVKDTTIKNKKYWKFSSTGRSYNSYDWIFKVRDKYLSVVRYETLEPVYYHRVTSEGGYDVNNKYIFNKYKKKIFTYTENSKKPFTKDTLNYSDCLFDVLSATYFTRCIDFNNFKKNDTLQIKTVIDNEIVTITIKYFGKETIKDRDDKTHNTYKFSTTVVEGSVFKGGEAIYVWVSQDKNKIPILIEAKILVGSVKVYLQQYKNLKY
jgi:hypothetical protein